MWECIKREPAIVYHYTKRGNVEQILNDRQVKKGKDTHSFFSETLEDTMIIMSNSVMNEGAVYMGLDGIPLKYGKFNPDEYVILELEPQYAKALDWYIWRNETNSKRYVMVDSAFKLEKIKIAYKGNMRFKNPRLIEVKDIIYDYCYLKDNKYILKDEFKAKYNL